MGTEHNVKWGFETRTGKFVRDGDRRFIQIETGLSDERHLRVFIPMKTLIKSPFCVKISKLGCYHLCELPPCDEGNIVKWALTDGTCLNQDAMVFISPDLIKDLVDLLNDAYEEIQKQP